VAYSDGQFDDARYDITLVQSFTMAGGNTMNYARVTDFRREAPGQISGVVVKEAASKFPRRILSEKLFLGQREVHRATVSCDVGEVVSLLILST
jgi:glycerol-3-phosphate dehydrogenase